MNGDFKTEDLFLGTRFVSIIVWTCVFFAESRLYKVDKKNVGLAFPKKV